MMTGGLSWLDLMTIAIALVLSFLMLRKRIRDAELWRAMVTPLASIIGSGFLIVAPLLTAVSGPGAPAAMLGIVLLAFWIGSAIRFNMMHYAGDTPVDTIPFTGALERSSDIALALAYMISIAFYTRLMSGFLLTGIGAFSEVNSNILATSILAFIGLFGFTRGLRGLERLEEYSVTIKLAIIASLLVGLGYHDFEHGYHLDSIQEGLSDPWKRLRLLAGMLLVVQGFETSKYLGSAHSVSVRVRSMLWAQILAGTIYMVFVVLAMPLMASIAGLTPKETGVIDMAAEITFVLPFMLIIGAAMSQFSAAIADTLGSGGVIEAESKQRVSARVSYPLICLCAVALIWSTNIFEAVALASRAFALYYLLQVLLAIRLAATFSSGKQRLIWLSSLGPLAAVLIAIVIFAEPVGT